MSNLYYLFILACSVFFPLVLSFYPKNPFYKNFKYVFLSIVFVLVVFIPWDVFFTLNKVWGFNSDYVLGLYLLSLPFEEWLFFVVVNFSTLFIFHLIEINLKVGMALKLASEAFFYFAILILFFCLIISVPEKSYTFTASLVGILLALIVKVSRLGLFRVYFLISYLISLVPFFIVNGALTGLWSSEPVVLYDDTKNLSIRFFSIPLDDLIYNFDMILLASFTYFVSKNSKSDQVFEEYEQR